MYKPRAFELGGCKRLQGQTVLAVGGKAAPGVCCGVLVGAATRNGRTGVIQQIEMTQVITHYRDFDRGLTGSSWFG